MTQEHGGPKDLAAIQEEVGLLWARVDRGEEVVLGEDEQVRLVNGLFQLNPATDKEFLAMYLRYVTVPPTVVVDDGNLYYTHQDAAREGRLKYTRPQLEAGEWEEADFVYVEKIIRQGNIERYFKKLAQKYDSFSPVEDSQVRRTIEQAVTEDLQAGKPVLVRSHWRMGSSSLIKAVTQRNFAENSIVTDCQGFSYEEGTPIEVVGQTFAIWEIAEYIASKQVSDPGLDAYDRGNAVEREIESSGKTPAEFLNDFLAERGETAILAVEEAVTFEDPQRLQLIAQIKDLPNIKLMVMLHRISAMEGAYSQVFEGFTSHYLQPVDLEEATMIIRGPLEGSGIRFTDGAIKALYEASGGRPMEINSLCQLLLDPSGGEKTHYVPRVIYDEASVRAMIDHVLKSNLMYDDGFLRNVGNNYEQIWYVGLRSEERELITQIARDGISFGEEVNVGAIQPLIDLALVQVEPDKKTYRVNGELLRAFILKRSVTPRFYD